MTSDAASIDDDAGWEWARVEVFGHRQHYGRIREDERFGAKMMRIDVPTHGDPDAHGWQTVWYPGSALFSVAHVTRDVVMQANRPFPAARLLSSFDEDERDSEDDSQRHDGFGAT